MEKYCGGVQTWEKLELPKESRSGYYEEFLKAVFCKSCLDVWIKGKQTNMESELAFVLSFSVTGLQKTNRTGRVV